MYNFSLKKIVPVLALSSSLFLAGTAHADSNDWSLPTTTDNAPTCDVSTVGGDDVTGEFPAGRIAANGPEVTGQVIVTGESDCKVDVTLTTWTAPNGFDGKPYDEQAVYETKTLQFSVGTHDITVHLPSCYYQADLVRGDAAAGYNGTPIYETGRMIASLHGGTASCDTTTGGTGSGSAPVDTTPTAPVVPVVPVTPVIPTVPVTPVTPAAPVPTPVETSVTTNPTPTVTSGSVLGTSTSAPVASSLPVTGSGDGELILSVVVAVGGAAARKLRRR